MSIQKRRSFRLTSRLGEVAVVCGLGLLLNLGIAHSQERKAEDVPFRGALVDTDWALERDFTEEFDPSVESVVIAIDASDELERLKEALEGLSPSGFDLYYWIEVGRNPGFAASNPEWMGSIQTHSEWRRHFPDAPEESANTVIKAYPWVPISYEASFDAHFTRVVQLVGELPAPTGVFLNDLQGPPSVCGCGNGLCRWTTDYGPKTTASRLGDDAPARFLKKLAARFSEIQWIPVWATECEARDKPTHCAGVGCYSGACWKAWTRQLEPVATVAETIGLLTLSETFLRTQGTQISGAQWIQEALRMPQTEMRRHNHAPVRSGRLIAMIEAVALSEEEIEAQKDAVEAAGAQGWLLSLVPIEQSWEPKAVPLTRPLP